MVNYSCLNCQKIFKQKSHYDKHLERKTQCKKDNIIEKLVEEKIQQLLQKQKFDIFTPDLIAKEMSSHFPNKINKLLEPSIGTGNLLKYINYKKCIGYDINKTYTSEIKKAEIRIEDFILANITEKFDGVIMNPPYLRYQEMSEEQRLYITKTFTELSSGNIDLYLAFVLKAFECLNENGVLVAIIPASYLYNISSTGFRNFILRNKYVKYIKNFEEVKVFQDADVYCSILVLTKVPNETYTYETMTNKYIRNAGEEILSDNIGVPFSSFCKKITNGIATLADNIFIHKRKLFEEPCWMPIFKISKQELHWIIYPYENGTIIPEVEFKQNNPLTYEYLEKNKEALSKRDKGKKIYKAWYAFGREQSVKLPQEKCIFIPTLSSENLEKVCIREPSLFYSGICVIPNNEANILLDKIIKSKKNLANLCSKRSGKWINITVGALKQFKVLESTE